METGMASSETALVRTFSKKADSTAAVTITASRRPPHATATANGTVRTCPPAVNCSHSR